MPTVGFQNRLRHRDGDYRWLEWSSTLSPDGSIAFAVARDITDRKRLEDRRAHRERRLESRNETLHERAVRDPLTGLHNRRFFDRAVVALERRWRRQSASRRPDVAVILLDLDHFGQVNKNHGHQAGDAVLRAFSSLLKERFRERDLLVRFGGEEFVAILEGATADVAVKIAEGIRDAFEHLAIEVGEVSPIHVTVSGGCSQFGPDGDALAALSQADVCLSAAKRAGRNQVVGP
jgi:diguanylate cyclase (GGDEF)-like protein